MMDPKSHKEVFKDIQDDLVLQLTKFKQQGKILEAHRLEQRVTL